MNDKRSYVDLEILKATIRKFTKCNYSKKENIILETLKAVKKHKKSIHRSNYNGLSKR